MDNNLLFLILELIAIGIMFNFMVDNSTVLPLEYHTRTHWYPCVGETW